MTLLLMFVGREYLVDAGTIRIPDAWLAVKLYPACILQCKVDTMAWRPVFNRVSDEKGPSTPQNDYQQPILAKIAARLAQYADRGKLPLPDISYICVLPYVVRVALLHFWTFVFGLSSGVSDSRRSKTAWKFLTLGPCEEARRMSFVFGHQANCFGRYVYPPGCSGTRCQLMHGTSRPQLTASWVHGCCCGL